MKCKLCEDKLLEYLYGELGEEEATAMEQHLEASEPCRRVYDGFASVLETVDEEGEEGPSPALHTRIMGHAEEARPGRRSFWAWMFRPAVTTAVIGAVAAVVYFTSLRHKPPSLLDERTLSEESLVGKWKQRSAPPSSISKKGSPKKEAKDEAFLARLAEPPSNVKVDSPGKEAEEQGFLAKLAESEPRQTTAQEAAAPERLEAQEKSDPVPRARPAEKKSQFVAAGSMDEELAPAQARKKSDTVPSEEDRAVAGEMERQASQAYGARAVPLSAPPGRDLTVSDTPIPPTIARAMDLALEGECIEAGKRVEAYATDHPKEKASGAGWLEAARCYAKQGDTEAARKMAEEALKIPAYESEARTFLDTLPP